MRRKESSLSLAFSAALTFTAGACQANQEPNPNDFIFRASVREMSDEGQPLNDKVLQCFSDNVKYESNDSDELVIFLGEAYCPDKNLNKKYIGSSNTQFESIKTDELNMGLFRIEVTNQRESYLKCGLPVPSPFTFGKTCGN